MMQYQEDKFHPLNGDFSDDRYYVNTRAMKIGKILRRVGRIIYTELNGNVFNVNFTVVVQNTLFNTHNVILELSKTHQLDCIS